MSLSPVNIHRYEPGLRIVFLGLLLGIVFSYTIHFPAFWLSEILKKNTEGHLFLEDTQGSLWNGSARLILSDTHERAVILPGRIHWNMYLIESAAQLDFSFDCCSSEPIHITFSYDQGSLTTKINGTVQSLPASIFSGLGHPWSSLRPQGRIQIRFDHLGIISPISGAAIQPTGSAFINVTDLCSSLSLSCPLGNYSITYVASKSKISAKNSPGSLLEISLDAHRISSQWHASGFIQANERAGDSLNTLLTLFGTRQGHQTMIEYPHPSLAVPLEKKS